jgi:hypothetical protein
MKTYKVPSMRFSRLHILLLLFIPLLLNSCGYNQMVSKEEAVGGPMGQCGNRLPAQSRSHPEFSEHR